MINIIVIVWLVVSVFTLLSYVLWELELTTKTFNRLRLMIWLFGLMSAVMIIHAFFSHD